MDAPFAARRPPPPSCSAAASEPSCASSQPAGAVFRLLCPAPKAGGVVSGSRDLAGARVRVLDEPPPASSRDDRVILISSAECATAGSSLTEPEDRNNPALDSESSGGIGASSNVGRREELSPAQRALVRVFEKIVSVERNRVDDGASSDPSRSSSPRESGSGRGYVVCRMLARSDQVDRQVLERIESIRHESGASVTVLPLDHQSFASSRDELIEISGKFPAVKKALLSVSSCLQENPRADSAKSGATAAKASGGLPSSTSSHMDPFPKEGHPSGRHAADHLSMGYPPYSGPEVIGANRRMVVEEEVIFKLLCQREKVGSVIGKGGSVVRAMQNETGAFIKVADGSPDSDEKVIIISARENSDQIRSAAQDAVMRVHHRITEIGFEPGVAVIARLLVPSQQIGFLVGKGGFFINELKRATGASIRVFVKEHSQKFDSHYHEVVQVVGNLHSVQDALFHITGRIRETIFPMKSPRSNFAAPPHLPPFNEMPPPFSRPRHNPQSPGHYPHSPGHYPHPHGMDRPIPPPPPFDLQPPFPHGVDRSIPPREHIPHPYGGDRPGYGPPFDRPPSPRMWTPQGFSGSHPRGMPDFGSSRAPGSWPFGSGNPGPMMASASIEILIPQNLLGHVHGEDDSNLNQIRQISGAMVDIHDQKHGASEGVVVVSGTADQVRAAQSLVHAFILCGQTS
ncbi:hypothetical protein ACJRO7_025832 [Eucalyptus globulus]|uniref:K Homology domain-containing protein n=1 Tax=Eucalyptus globulus TaxID=34317 RepID=A0ABD3KIS1_EUCGL